MNEQPVTTIRLRSHFHHDAELDLYLLTGAEHVLRNLTSELRIHGTDDRVWKVQLELEGTLSQQQPHQLVSWAFLVPPRSSDLSSIMHESSEKDVVYKASFTLDSADMKPITSRVFSPDYLLRHFSGRVHTKPLLDFLDSVLPHTNLLVVMFLYEVQASPEPLPLLTCGNNVTQFLREIGLAKYQSLLWQFAYRDLGEIVFRMSNKERNEMFQRCFFSLRDRAHFVGICMEYAEQIGRPVHQIY